MLPPTCQGGMMDGLGDILKSVGVNAAMFAVFCWIIRDLKIRLTEAESGRKEERDRNALLTDELMTRLPVLATALSELSIHIKALKARR